MSSSRSAADSTATQKWTSAQKHTFVGGVGAWTMDGLDYFLLTFVLTLVADGLHTSIVTVSTAITLTLIGRPVGALIFGALAERFGRKHVLEVNIAIFALVELASAFSPNIGFFLVMRVIYGIAMGGVWGVASALTMETVPQRSRGWVSGVFQAGYPAGYLIAAILYGLLATQIGWRGLFAIGVVPLLLAVYMFFFVEESPVWKASRNQPKESKPAFWPAVVKHWPILIYAIIVMAAFNFLAHGTQDIYPTFLTEQKGYSPALVSTIAIAYNIAAILGGTVAGALSQKLGRKWTIVIAVILVLPAIPLWVLTNGAVWLGVGAVLVQFFVQGAWGVIPAYLNELMPAGTRAILPGFVYQVGNVIASPNATLQTSLAEANGGNYAIGMALVTAIVVVIIALMIGFGRDTRYRNLAKE